MKSEFIARQAGACTRISGAESACSARAVPVNHGRRSYKDTTPQMSSLLVCNRVYRLEIHSVGIFDRLCEALPL